MADHVSTDKRSEIMRAVKSKGSVPEMAVRKLVFSMGYHYRLHRKSLLRMPDLVFLARRKADIRARMFLAWTSLQEGKVTEVLAGILGAKNQTKSATRYLGFVQLSRLGWSSFQVW